MRRARDHIESAIAIFEAHERPNAALVFRELLDRTLPARSVW